MLAPETVLGQHLVVGNDMWLTRESLVGVDASFNRARSNL